ncbi:RNA cytidine acetyltransferase 1-like isoform X2 [Rutidosis leptorrhynchoides]|uniref:RNA cytidine acetyltransferase 1-like isoform X2 n=1 Tax=Rutidosis leptorrhynchoides TaxID=125765 RepID=UPI003A9A45FA
MVQDTFFTFCLHHLISVDEDLDEAPRKVKDDFKVQSEGLMNPEYLQRYAIADKDAESESALQNGGVKIPSGGVISVKSSKSKAEKYLKPNFFLRKTRMEILPNHRGRKTEHLNPQF